MSKVIRIDEQTEEKLKRFKNKLLERYNDDMERGWMEDYYSKPNNLVRIALIYCLQNMK